LRDIPPCAVESRDGPSERRWVENTFNDFSDIRLIDELPPRRLAARFLIRQATFADARGNGRDAPETVTESAMETWLPARALGPSGSIVCPLSAVHVPGS
jgi:hypothetical protein